METQFGAAQTLFQGIPISTVLAENTALGSASIYSEGRVISVAPRFSPTPI